MGQIKHRTQISLEDWQYQTLRDISRRTRKSLSGVIRDLLTEKFTRQAGRKMTDPIQGIVAMGAGDGAPAAREHDAFLYGKKR